MKYIRTGFKNLLASMFIALVLFVPLISLVPTPPKVFAAGEKFKWGNDFYSIDVSGGDVDNVTLKATEFNPYLAQGVTEYKNQCRVSLDVYIDQNDSSKMNLFGRKAPDVASDGSQNVKPACGMDIVNSFTGPGTISGNRVGAGAETEAQKRVTFQIDSGTTSAQAPGSITVTIKKDNKVVAGPNTITQTPGPGEEDTPPDQRGARYYATFTLDPGDYQVCVAGILEECYNFTKTKYKPYGDVLGESYDNRRVDVEVETRLTKPVSDTATIGPFDVTLTKEGGGPVTVQTDSVTSGPTNKDQEESISYETVESTLRAAFSNVEPGKYKVCIGGTKKCKDVEKKKGEILKVNFSLTSDEVKAASLAGAEEDETSLCPDKLKEWVFSWAACPLVEGVQTAISTIRIWVYKQLLSDTLTIFGTDDKQTGYYRVWNSFRVLAVALIVIFGIIMVASEALGFGIFSAYTIRAVLPRLLIMAIIISLSWWIFQYVTILFNNITVWIYSGILAPFSLKVDPLDGGAVALQLLAVIVAAAFINPLVILSYAGTLLIAFLVASLIFAIRKIAIILLIVTSPVWLACFVLEGTKKVASIAIGGIISLYIMGPAFGAVQAAADAVTLTADDKTDPFGIIRVGAAVAGIAAILLIFIKLGGMASTITGTMRRQASGALGKMSKMRSQQYAQNAQAMGEGTRWSGRNVLTRGLNRATSGATIAAKTGIPYNPGDWRRRYSQGRSHSTQAAAVSAMKNPKWGLIRNDDEALRAGTFSSHSAAIEGLRSRYMARGQSAAQATQNAQDAVARFEATGLKIGAAGVGLASAQGLVSTGTGYTDIGDMIDTSARVAGRDKSVAAAFGGWANFETKQKGRNDMAPGAGSLIGAIQQQMDFNNAAYDSFDAEGNKVHQGQTVRRVSQMDLNRMTVEGSRSANASSIMGGNKTGSIENIVRAQSALLDDAHHRVNTATTAQQRDAAQADLGRVVSEIQNMRDSGIYGSSANVEALYGKAGLAPGRVPRQDVIDQAQQAAQARPTQATETVIRTEQRPKPGGRPGEMEDVQVMRQEQRVSPNAVVNQRHNDANQALREANERFNNRSRMMRQ